MTPTTINPWHGNRGQPHATARSVIGGMTVLLIACSGWSASSVLAGVELWNNGPFITGIADGPIKPDGLGRYDTSDAGMANSDGQLPLNGVGAYEGLYHVADDFIVPAGQQWVIESARFYGYQNRYYNGVNPPWSPFKEVRVTLWQGTPGSAGSSVLIARSGNVMTDTGFTGVYRYRSGSGDDPTTGTVLNRPIAYLDADLTGWITSPLGPGTYWIEWSYLPTRDDGNSFAILTEPSNDGGNAMQYIADPNYVVEPMWDIVRDSFDNLTGQSVNIPFVLQGESITIPEPRFIHYAWLMLTMGLLLLPGRRS